jgi:pyruvate,orthophosphate dikinase
MILAEDEKTRRKAVMKLLPFQRRDFTGIFRAMAGKPVTIRLLDPPLHEFLTLDNKQIARLAKDLGIKPARIRARIEQLHELNPMLGHRGCRLGITYPEITEMQARAILEAAVTVTKQKIKVFPEIMIPLVGTRQEFENQEAIIRRVAEEVQAETKTKVNYLVGTMIETPRACLVADSIAEGADFFSFGTNDLTQMGFGYSRDDSGAFLPEYVEKDILAADPFQTLDQEGIGQLVQMGVKKGRSVRSDLKIGICGEHGGDPSSVMFCHRIGLDYVSCSPFRVPVARFAAALAALETPRKGKASKKK